MADDFEAIVERVLARTGLTRDELMVRITRKRRDLDYAVTLEGAARMVEKELEGRG